MEMLLWQLAPVVVAQMGKPALDPSLEIAVLCMDSVELLKAIALQVPAANLLTELVQLIT